MTGYVNQKCPVCDSVLENGIIICDKCGYDMSTDYVAFPTLQAISESCIPASQLRKKQNEDNELKEMLLEYGNLKARVEALERLNANLQETHRNDEIAKSELKREYDALNMQKRDCEKELQKTKEELNNLKIRNKQLESENDILKKREIPLKNNTTQVSSVHEKTASSADKLYSMAMNYVTGKNGYPDNPVKAAECFLQAAQLGHTEAQYEIGRRYESGNGIGKNVDKALEWYEKSAWSGNRNASASENRLKVASGLREKILQKDVERLRFGQTEDGLVNEIMERVNRYFPGSANDLKTIKYYAYLGNANAQYWLGYLIKNGRGFARDPKAAEYWLRRSAAQGNVKAKQLLNGQ